MSPLQVLVQALSEEEYDRLYELFRERAEDSWVVGPEYHVFCALSHDQGRRFEIAVREEAA